MKKINDPLSEELAEKHSELEAQRKMRDDHHVQLNLDSILNQIKSKAETIDSVLKTTGGKGQKMIMQTVEKEIIRSAEETLWCPDFSFRPNADQDINCYVGSYWVALDAPVWKYFIIQGAERCGLPEDLMMDADFKKKLVNNTASNIFQPRQVEIPNDEVWLNMPDKTLVIKSDGSVSSHPHCPDDLFFYSLDYYYDEKAECPKWHKFLDRVLPEKAAQTVLAEYFCYILMKSHRYERMLWLFGPGQNGKSTVLKVLTALLGSANISTISLSSLTKDQKTRHGIEHKMLNISSETGRDVDPDVLKQLVTGEKVTIERKYHDARQTDDYGKFIVATNDMPKAENTYAFFRRMIVMPFEVVIPDGEKDPHLFDKLKAELPGVLNWALAAFPGLIKRNEFTESELCTQALKRYIAQADSVSLFVDQMCMKSETPTRGDFLYNVYKDFCNFIKPDKKEGRNGFFERLTKLGLKANTKPNEAKQFKLKLSE